MQHPQYTIIVPIYNASAYLHACIGSILSQSFSDFELLLVDDGSTDGSFQVCEEFARKDGRIRLFHKENGGEASARNFGLQQARGEYICWVDADDMVAADYLADLARYSHDDIDLVIQSLVRIDSQEERKVTGVKSGSYDLSEASGQQAFFSTVDLDHFGVSVSKAFRHSIIRQHDLAYSSDIRLAVDLDFLFRYLCHCRYVVVVDHANYNYIIRQGSVSGRIYDCETEFSGMRQISTSAALLCRKFSIPQVERIQGFTIAAYIHRMLISIYKPQISKSHRLSFMNELSSREIELYGKYGPKQTLFLRLMNSLFVHHRYQLFDKLMLLVYRYRYPLS